MQKERVGCSSEYMEKLSYGTNSTKVSASQIGKSESGLDLSQAGVKGRAALGRGHDSV